MKIMRYTSVLTRLSGFTRLVYAVNYSIIEEKEGVICDYYCLPGKKTQTLIGVVVACTYNVCVGAV